MIEKRIQQKMRELNLKQVDLVRATKASKSTVHGWVNGITAPKGENLFKLAGLFRVEAEWLLSGTMPPKKGRKADYEVREPPAEYAGDFDTWDSGTPLHSDEVEIPFYKEVELAAGNGLVVQREDAGRKLRFAKSTLRKAGVDIAAAACVTVNGDSMKPVLPDGATVGIDTASRRIKDGEMYAIDHDGQLRVKVIHRIGGSGLRLRSFNTSDYPDEDYFDEQAKSIRVIGRVFWYSVLR